VLDALGRPLSRTSVRLRDVNTARIVGQQSTDDAGLFSFTDVDSGSYVVELMGDNLRVEATSALLTVGIGILAVIVTGEEISPN
jgi:hypothetical protein